MGSLIIGFFLLLIPVWPAAAQEEAPGTTGVYVAGTVGRLFEAWEGYSGSTNLWTVAVGYDFNPRWGVRAEIVPAIEICDEDAVVIVAGVRQEGYCHRHGRFINPTVIRRFESFYLLFGWFRAGLGTEWALGDRLRVSAEADLLFAFSSASVWPRVGLKFPFGT